MDAMLPTETVTSSAIWEKAWGFDDRNQLLLALIFFVLVGWGAYQLIRPTYFAGDSIQLLL